MCMRFITSCFSKKRHKDEQPMRYFPLDMESVVDKMNRSIKLGEYALALDYTNVLIHMIPELRDMFAFRKSILFEKLNRVEDALDVLSKIDIDGPSVDFDMKAMITVRKHQLGRALRKNLDVEMPYKKICSEDIVCITI